MRVLHQEFVRRAVSILLRFAYAGNAAALMAMTALSDAQFLHVLGD